jgi:hypothetical protein
MSALAAIRPDEWELPLFIHVLGAMVLVGTLVLAVVYFVAGRRGSADATRAGFRTLQLGVIPSYFVMRIAAQWLASEEGVEDSDAAWITIGFVATDVGLLCILIATIAAGLAVRRTKRTPGGSLGPGPTIAAVLGGVLLVAYLVALWAMTTKPV